MPISLRDNIFSQALKSGDTNRADTRVFLAGDAKPLRCPINLVRLFPMAVRSRTAVKAVRTGALAGNRLCGDWMTLKTTPRPSKPAYRLRYGAKASRCISIRCTAWHDEFSAICCLAGRSSLPTARRPTRQK